MADKAAITNITRKTCNGCGGSGQISFFRGVSRFVMDWDDCPDCFGTGYIEVPTQDDSAKMAAPDTPGPGLND